MNRARGRVSARRGGRLGLVGLALTAALVAACASTPETRPATRADGDRTDDPEFQAARRAVEPDFATQADALASGVYERFVHPDSVRPAADLAPGAEEPAAGIDTGGEDPTTEELLGTLPGQPWYDRAEPSPSIPERPSGEPGPGTPRAEPAGRGVAPTDGDAPDGRWTLQLGAYTTETGALVRIRQLEREFPDLPRWYAGEAGLWRVYLGRWAERPGAERGREAVVARGFVDAWVARVP